MPLDFDIIWNKHVSIKAYANDIKAPLPTKISLHRRKVLGSNHLWCVLCVENIESARHVFYECEVAFTVWMKHYK